MNDQFRAAVTVAEMARMVGPSRSRFYQLIGSAFPQPSRDDRGRPYYDEEQQRVCLEVRRRNCGIDGKPVLFYALKHTTPAAPRKPGKAQRRHMTNSKFADILDGVKALGLTGARVSDVVGLELHDLILGERSGLVVFRNGKGGKQRTVPLPLPARRALAAYLESRPPVRSDRVFAGERGPLTVKGVRSLCDKYSAFIGVKLHPHLLRHTMAHKFLDDNPGDLVGLAQILGHENLNTTGRCVERTEGQLGEAVERTGY